MANVAHNLRALRGDMGPLSLPKTKIAVLLRDSQEKLMQWHGEPANPGSVRPCSSNWVFDPI